MAQFAFLKTSLLPAHKLRLAVALVVVAVVAGIWWASRPSQVDKAGGGTGSGIISEIQLGALASPEEASKQNPRFIQKEAYTTDDALVMRITSAPQAPDSFEVGVRLLTPTGSILQLMPSSATFEAGTSSFCCWNITQAGDYTLQIFRPEKTVSTLPLLIRQAQRQQKGDIKTNLKLF
ncbi:MAG: hypothetical protein HYZ62_01745 [Candidatus Andersenbacteria bacterium]|nr:hypothetical protein [Candidatus Andersenbacteria bacterium]